MYPLFLVVCVAVVILSPLALELFLTAWEYRALRKREQANESPRNAWASSPTNAEQTHLA